MALCSISSPCPLPFPKNRDPLSPSVLKTQRPPQKDKNKYKTSSGFPLWTLCSEWKKLFCQSSPISVPTWQVEIKYGWCLLRKWKWTPAPLSINTAHGWIAYVGSLFSISWSSKPFPHMLTHTHHSLTHAFTHTHTPLCSTGCGRVTPTPSKNDHIFKSSNVQPAAPAQNCFHHLLLSYLRSCTRPS